MLQADFAINKIIEVYSDQSINRSDVEHYRQKFLNIKIIDTCCDDRVLSPKIRQ